MIVFNVNYILCLYLLQTALKLHARRPVPRMVGGDAGDPTVHQHVVRMEYRKERFQRVEYQHVCTATAITPVWVLTAAHCIAFLEGIISLKRHYKGVIRYGSAIPWTNHSFSDIIAMEKHPAYAILETREEDNMRNDIGLLKTAPILLNQYGKISAMDYKTLLGLETLATGYGDTRHDGKTGYNTLKRNKTLQVFKVVINKCTSEDRNNLYPAICFSRLCGRANTLCPGDSGGPLLHPSGIVGVNSISNVDNCYSRVMQHDFFAQATPVSPYIGWITNHVRKNGT